MIKHKLLFICIVLGWSCGSPVKKENDKDKQFDSETATLSNTYNVDTGLHNRNQELPEPEGKIKSTVNIANTPVFKDRIATQDDVKNGLAIFSIEGKGKKHTPANIKLPFYALMTYQNEQVTAIIVQAEVLDGDTLYGYKNGKGVIGMCTSSEFSFK
ncbi:MAG: hypothetical protein IAE67_04455 [Candidatus Competibacteraceae bacterium]|nr:hypothetical protein [Candidatus Competibacteraceae bacterium]